MRAIVDDFRPGIAYRLPQPGPRMRWVWGAERMQLSTILARGLCIASPLPGPRMRLLWGSESVKPAKCCEVLKAYNRRRFWLGRAPAQEGLGCAPSPRGPGTRVLWGGKSM